MGMRKARHWYIGRDMFVEGDSRSSCVRVMLGLDVLKELEKRLRPSPI